MFFMTRSDVFKPWLKPITWSSQMVPIYRAEQDGGGTYDKNQEIFVEVQKVLKQRKNLIMFGEGLTYDTFMRSLKPLRKGPARIAINTMESTNWEIDLKIRAVGINYANPGTFRADVVVKFGDPILLKDLKPMYDENPNKVMTHIIRTMQNELEKNTVFLADKKKLDFFEHLLILSRKGMNDKHYDPKIPVIEKFEYSQKLGQRINNEYQGEETQWEELKSSTDNYFKKLEENKVDESFVYQFQKNNNKKSLFKNWLFLLLTFPIFILGAIHSAIPYFAVKKLVEKMFKRPVFWSGVKAVLGGLFWLIYTLPIFWLFDAFLYPALGISDFWIGFIISWIYFWTIPAVTFIFWHYWIQMFKQTLEFGKQSDTTLSTLVKERKSLLAQMAAMNI
ncbi:hypothetical protein K6119_05990 [Paracrocinitomix mangrovi]|nr:hypothetical protein [Paracrocinitomix mangrovi]UKN03061.1 hypothetical protein K6119_05990 [Paracrocinitomix mangrovi]